MCGRSSDQSHLVDPLFLVLTSATHLVYVLFCLWGGAYKISLLLIKKIVAYEKTAAGFLPR